MLKTKIKDKSKVIVCDNARPDLINMLVLNGYNAVPCLGKKKLATLQLLQSYKLFVTPESASIQDELYNYKWKDRAGEVPEDGNDHSIDAIGYYLRWFDYSY
jgi:phage terminase large subunit